MVNKNNTKTVNEKLYSVQLLLETKSVRLNIEYIHELYFIEDIFSNCIMGSITFHDIWGITEFGPFTGNEKIVVVYGAENDVELMFDIWNMKRVIQGNPVNPIDTKLITLTFVDVTFGNYTTKRYSRSWNNEKVTTIMKHITDNMLGFKDYGIKYEESSNKMSFVMPYWTPLQAMKYLCKRAIGNKSKTGGYLVYNNTYGEQLNLNMYSINYLFNDENKTYDPDIYYFESNSSERQNLIQDWWFSMLDKTGIKGIKGGKWRGYDFTKKELKSYEYTYADGVSDTVMFGKKSLFPDISETSSLNKLIGESDDKIIEAIAYDEWIKRYSLQMVANFILLGHEKRFAGMIIDVVWPSTLRKKEKYDKGLEGRYMIKSVTHYFTKGRYYQRITAIKNAYTSLDSLQLLNTTKRNIFNKRSIGK